MRRKKRLSNQQQRHQTGVDKAAGLIYSQSWYSEVPFGYFTTGYCGCSWIALYNAMILLGKPQPATQIMDALEARPFARGLILNGLLGTYPWALAYYIRQQGYRTKIAWGAASIRSHAARCRVWILFYLRPNFSGHYVAVKRLEHLPGAYYHFYNERNGDKADIRLLDQFFREANATLKAGIMIYESGELQ